MAQDGHGNPGLPGTVCFNSPTEVAEQAQSVSNSLRQAGLALCDVDGTGARVVITKFHLALVATSPGPSSLSTSIPRSTSIHSVLVLFTPRSACSSSPSIHDVRMTPSNIPVAYAPMPRDA